MLKDDKEGSERHDSSYILRGAKLQTVLQSGIAGGGRKLRKGNRMMPDRIILTIFGIQDLKAIIDGSLTGNFVCKSSINLL